MSWTLIIESVFSEKENFPLKDSFASLVRNLTPHSVPAIIGTTDRPNPVTVGLIDAFFDPFVLTERDVSGVLLIFSLKLFFFLHFLSLTSGNFVRFEWFSDLWKKNIFLGPFLVLFGRFLNHCGKLGVLFQSFKILHHCRSVTSCWSHSKFFIKRINFFSFFWKISLRYVAKVVFSSSDEKITFQINILLSSHFFITQSSMKIIIFLVNLMSVGAGNKLTSLLKKFSISVLIS